MVNTSRITNKIEFTTITGSSTLEYNGKTESYLSWNKQHPFVFGWTGSSVASTNFLQDDYNFIWVGFGGDNPESRYNIDIIYQGAFYGCTQLQTIKLPETVNTIHITSFYGCTNLTKIEIPHVKYIQSQSFEGCTSLQEITLPESLEQLSSEAFLNCTSLKRVYCNSTTPPRIGPYDDPENWFPFEGNAEGRKIIVPRDYVDDYKKTDGWSNYADDIIGDNETTKILYTTNDGNIVEVYSDSFEGAVEITENSYNLGEGKIVFLGTVTSIKEDAFADSSNLLSITIPSSVNEIEVSAFSNCDSLESVTIESEDINIAEDSFYGCSSIKEFIRKKGNFTEISLSLICNGTLIRYAVGNDYLDYDAPDSVTKIGKNSFQDSKLQSVAFNNVNYVSVASFTNSNELKYIYFFTNIEDGIITAENNAFPKNDNLIIHVPRGTLNLYKESEYWNIYNIVENMFAPYNKILYIEGGELKEKSSGSKITSISYEDKEDYKNATNIYLPYTLEEFHEAHAYPALSDLQNLQSIVIPYKVKSLSSRLFEGCYNLNSVVLYEGITTIGTGAFIGCTNLKELDIPASVTTIYGSAFDGDYLLNLYCRAVNPPQKASNSISGSGKNIIKLTNREFNTNIYVPNDSLSAYRACDNEQNEWFYYQDSIIEIDYNEPILNPTVGFNLLQDKLEFEMTNVSEDFSYGYIPYEKTSQEGYLDDFSVEGLSDWVTVDNITSENRLKIRVENNLTDREGRSDVFYIYYKNDSYNTTSGYTDNSELKGIKRTITIRQRKLDFVAPTIDIDPENINFNNEKGEGEFTYTIEGNEDGEINTSNIKYESSDTSWLNIISENLTFSEDRKTVTGKVIFEVKENTDNFTGRTGTITVRYNYQLYQVWDSITINQSAAPTKITFNNGESTYTHTIPNKGYPDGGAKTISFTLNNKGDNDTIYLLNSEGDWYSAIIYDTYNIALLAYEYNGTYREAKITVQCKRDGNVIAEAYLYIKQGELGDTPSTTLDILSGDNINYSSDANNGVIQYALNNPISGLSLSVKSNVNWITNLEILELENTIKYNIEANTNTSSRTGIITVSYGDLISVDVTIIQEGKESPSPTITIDEDYKNNTIGSEGGTIGIGYSIKNSIQDGKVEVQTNNIGWVTVNGTTGYISITVSENLENNSREAKIDVYYEGSSDFFIIKQEAADTPSTPDDPDEPDTPEDPELPDPTLDLISSSTIDVSYYYNSKTIEYKLTNPKEGINIEVESSVSWIHSFEIYEDYIKFYVYSNNDTDFSRQGTITVSYGNSQFTVTVNQGKKQLNTRIVIDKYTSNFTYLGGSGYIDYNVVDPIESNKVSIYIPNASWVTINSNNNNKVSFTVSINEFKNIREGTIILIYGDIRESITITQDYNKNDYNIINYIASSPIYTKEDGFNTHIKTHLYNYQNKSGKLIFADNVTKINKEAFIDCNTLEEITIPDSVKVIGKRAFVNCHSLRTFKGKFAFDSGRCLKDGDRMIAFAASNTSYSIPDSIKIIYPNTFEGCINLREVTIPESVSSIGDCSFKDCANLETITCLSKTPPNIGTGVFNNDKYIIYVDYSCLEDYKNSEAWYPYKDHIMPFNAEIAENKYSEIRYKTTDGNKLNLYNTNNFGVNIISHSYKKGVGVIKFDGELYKIGDWAFAYCYNLSEIHIPDTTIVIGKNAFLNCTSLSSISIPSSVKALGGKAFAGCFNLLNVELNEGLKVIGKEAFYYCINLYEVILPDSVKAINDFAFSECLSLTNLIIGENTSIIGGESFRGCVNLKRVRCKAILPPKINTFWDISWNAFDCTSKDLKIEVPESSYNNYIKAKGWKYYSNIITRFI